MRINSSLDWSAISAEMRTQMHAAPTQCRKDLARMIGSIEGLVQQLGNEEVELRRYKRETSANYVTLLVKVNESITEFEKWLMLAHLQHG